MSLFAICYTAMGVVNGLECYKSITKEQTANIRVTFMHKMKVAQDNGLIDMPKETVQQYADNLEIAAKVVTSIVIGAAWPVFTIHDMVLEVKEAFA